MNGENNSLTKSEANEIIFNPLGYHITSSGGLYRYGGSKIGVCAFSWGHPLNLVQINLLKASLDGPNMKELQTLCLVHDIKIIVLENS